MGRGVPRSKRVKRNYYSKINHHVTRSIDPNAPAELEKGIGIRSHAVKGDRGGSEPVGACERGQGALLDQEGGMDP